MNTVFFVPIFHVVQRKKQGTWIQEKYGLIVVQMKSCMTYINTEFSVFYEKIAWKN